MKDALTWLAVVLTAAAVTDVVVELVRRRRALAALRRPLPHGVERHHWRPCAPRPFDFDRDG